MSQRLRCDLCGIEMEPHAHYVLRMDIFADPSLPAMSSQEIEGTDFDDTFDKLMEQMKQMSAQELQDQVHQRLEYHLCGSCRARFLANPLGHPRQVRHGKN